MFKRKNYKKIVISILALTMIFGTVALAAEGIYTKQLKATYGRIKFNYEGSDVTKQIESKYGTPAFTTEDGRSYAPVRAMADLLGVDIEYDNKTHTVKITDPKVDEFNKKLAEKDKEIEKLKKEVNAKKEEAKKEEVNKTNLKSLQTNLNKEYDEYRDVEFDIVLRESKDTIIIDINPDLTRTAYKEKWRRIGDSNKRSLIKDVVDDVRKAFPNTAITGSIYDSSSKKDLYTFSQTKNGSLSISNRDYDYDYDYDRDYDDRYVYDRVKSEFDYAKIYDARLYELDYSGKSAYFEIEFSDKYEREWRDLTPSEIRDMLDSIAKEIEYDEYVDYIDGRIYMDNDPVGRYTKDYKDSYGEFTRQKY